MRRNRIQAYKTHHGNHIEVIPSKRSKVTVHDAPKI